jgi:hypothetical protein
MQFFAARFSTIVIRTQIPYVAVSVFTLIYIVPKMLYNTIFAHKFPRLVLEKNPLQNNIYGIAKHLTKPRYQRSLEIFWTLHIVTCLVECRRCYATES